MSEERKGTDSPTLEELNETYEWWCEINGGWDFAVRHSGDHRIIEEVRAYIKEYGPHKPSGKMIKGYN